MPYHFVQRRRGLGATGCVVTQGQPNGGAAVATDYGNTAITLSQAQALAAQLAPFVPGLVPFEQSSPQFPLSYSSSCGGAKAYGLQIPPVPTAGSAGNAPSFTIQDAGALLQVMSTGAGPLNVSNGSLYWGKQGGPQVPALLFNLPNYVAPPTTQVLWDPAVASGTAAPVPGFTYETAAQATAQPVPVSVAAPPVAAAPATAEPAYTYQTASGSAPASSSALFDFSSIPWWGWAAAAAVGLFMVTK